MPLTGVVTMPKTPGNKIKLEALLEFLRGSPAKEFTLTWECQMSKQIVGFRVERFKDANYPLSLEVIAPKIPYLPFFSYSLTDGDVRELITICKLELDTKWQKQVTFSS
jgi:hypothetical protein